MLLSEEGALRMLSLPRLLHHFVQLVWTLLPLLGNTACFWLLCLRPSVALAAENLFLRKQLALYQERYGRFEFVCLLDPDDDCEELHPEMVDSWLGYTGRKESR